jgi:rare lipoprotein A
MPSSARTTTKLSPSSGPRKKSVNDDRLKVENPTRGQVYNHDGNLICRAFSRPQSELGANGLEHRTSICSAVNTGVASRRRILRDKLVATASRSESSADTSKASSGIASVYSDRHTANGEQMSSDAMTAAHRTLPFGTKVTVVNRNNGRSAVVRINDRGPYVHGRVIDLSPAAAQALRVNGLAPVSLIVESDLGDEQKGMPREDAKESSPQLATPSPLKVIEPAQTAE